MNDHYQHTDRMVISVADSLSIMQSLDGNGIRNATRIITDQPGFLPGSFEPVMAAGGMDQSSSTFQIVFLVGSVIFPNGELFIGQGYRQKISVPKQLGYQYIKVKHQTLRRTEQKYAPGFGIQLEYAERIDGIKLGVTTDPTLSEAGDELFVVRIRYEPGMVQPSVEDIRDAWRFFWAPAEIIDPDEEIVPAGKWWNTRDIRSNINYGDPMTTVPFSPICDEQDLVYVEDQTLDTTGHAMETLAGINLASFRTWEPRPFGVRATHEYHSAKLPPGVNVDLAIRKCDIYRDVQTAWFDIDLQGEQDVPKFELDTALSASHGLLGFRIHCHASPSGSYYEGGFLKVWICDDYMDESIIYTPPTFEIPIKQIAAGMDADFPYDLYAPNPESESVYFMAVLVSPSQVMHDAIPAQEISLTTTALGPMRPWILNFGGDKGLLWPMDGGDYPITYDDFGTNPDYWALGGRIWYSGISNEKACHQFRVPGPAGSTFRISGAKFVNFQDSGTGDDITGTLYIRKRGDSQTVEVIDVGANDGALFPDTNVFEEERDWTPTPQLAIDLEGDTDYELMVALDAAIEHMPVRGSLTLYMQEVLS